MEGTTESAKSASTMKALKDWLPIVVGVVAGKYFGSDFLIPAIAIAVVWLIGSKLFQKEKRIFLPTFSIQVGHLLPALLFSIHSGNIYPYIVEATIPAIGLTWLMLKPGVGPLILLSIYQAQAIFVTTISFLNIGVGTDDHKVLLLHILLRFLALVYMVIAYSEFRKSRRTAIQPIDS